MSVKDQMETLLEDQEFYQVWEEVLGKLREKYDIEDQEGRVRFRMAVERKVANMKMSGIRELAKHYGAKRVPTSRDGASRALADAYMKTDK